VLSMHHFKTFL